MARKQITQLIDDLDGETLDDGGETILFSLDGRAYEIDLSSANAAQLREAFAPYVDVARSISSAPRNNGRPARARRARTDERDLGAVREWARQNGHTVSERGRVPAAILESYDEAHDN